MASSLGTARWEYYNRESQALEADTLTWDTARKPFKARQPGEGPGWRATAEVAEVSAMEARDRMEARGSQALDGRTANSEPPKNMLCGLLLLLQGLERSR